MRTPGAPSLHATVMSPGAEPGLGGILQQVDHHLLELAGVEAGRRIRQRALEAEAHGAFQARQERAQDTVAGRGRGSLAKRA